MDVNKEGAYGFPDPLADKKTKDSPAYILQYAKAMYGTFTKYGLRILANDKIKYRNQANYYLGLQQVDRYKKRMDIWNEDEPGKQSFLNIDWQVLNLAYKFVNIMTDKIVSAGYDVQLTAIDPLALDLRQEMENTMKAVMELKAWMNEVGLKLNPDELGFDPDLLPDHSDGLQMHMEMSVKDEFAMNGEMAINLHMNNNDFEQVRKEYIRDSVIYGIMCVETRNDKKGYTKIRRVSPEQVIIANSKSEDFKDASWGGYVESISFQELQTAAGSQFDEEQYRDIYNQYTTNLNNADTRFLYTPNIFQGSGERMVQVMKFYYKVDIQNTYVKKSDARGNMKLYKRGNGAQEKDDRELIRDTYEVVYEGRWIVGSDYIYEYGMLNDMEVDQSNPCETKIPLHVIYPNMLNGMSSSVLQSCIPILDAINIGWYQFQHLMAHVNPDGVAIDQDALANIALGSGGKKGTPKDILDLYYKKGSLIYSSRGLDGNSGNRVPVQPIENGTHEKAFSMLNNIFTLINVLRQLTGMNEGVDASTPAPDALVGTMQIAQSGALSALGYLFAADKLMVKHTAESLILLTQAAIRRGEVTGYVNSVGLGATKFWSVHKDITIRQYGFNIVVRPTAEQWAELYAQLAGAVEKGIMDYSDFSVIKEMTNLKEARKYMALVERRKRKEAQQQQEAIMQQQSQMNQEAALVTEQAKQQTLQMEMQLKSALMDKEKEVQLAVLDRKYGYDIQLKQMEVSQKSEAASMQARTKLVDTSLKNQSNENMSILDAIAKESTTKKES